MHPDDVRESPNQCCRTPVGETAWGPEDAIQFLRGFAAWADGFNDARQHHVINVHLLHSAADMIERQAERIRLLSDESIRLKDMIDRMNTALGD